MPQRATSRRRNIRGFGWLTEKKVTYRRDVAAERKQRKAEAIAVRKERLELKRLEAQEREIEAKARQAQARIEEAEQKLARAERKRADAADRKIEQEWREKGHRNPPCARTRKEKVTDRAKRYRANQPGCKPAGRKQCKICKATSDVMVDHKDGDESNGAKSNLRWLCRSCNTTLGAEMARSGEGRRTVQYNPGGAKNLGEYMQAVLQHTRGAHDEGGRIIHETPKRKRQEYASEIWAARKAHGNPHEDHYSLALFDGVSRIGKKYSFHAATLELAKRKAQEYADDMGRDAVLYGADGWSLGRFETARPGGYRRNNPTGPFKYKGVLITPVPPTFDRYDVALPSGTIRLSSLQDAKDWVSRSLDPRFTHTARGGNPDPKCPLCHKPIEPQHTAAHDRQGRLVHDYCQRTRGNPDTVYQTRAAAKAAWYDSAPGRNDRATFKKVRDGWIIKQALRWNPRSNWGYAVFYNKPGSAYLSQQQVAFYGTSAEAKADAKGRNADLKTSDPSAYYSGGQYTSRKAIRSANPETIQSKIDKLVDQINLHGHSLARARKLRELKEQRDKLEGLEAINPAGRTNPETDSEEYRQAKKIAELFHGRPVKEEITVTEQIRSHDWLWRIGPLVSLKIRTLTKRNAKLPFSQTEPRMVHLFCSPDGRQFYLRGGDQELDLEPIGMGPKSQWFRDHMLIGEAKEITYQDKKKFHKFKLIDYYHKLGEVTKQKPMLAYDSLAGKLQIIGGQYKVETDDLVDGMSPGIVN